MEVPQTKKAMLGVKCSSICNLGQEFACHAIYDILLIVLQKMGPLVFDKFVWSSGIFLVHADMFSLFDRTSYAVTIETISSVLLVNVVGM